MVSLSDCRLSRTRAMMPPPAIPCHNARNSWQIFLTWSAPSSMIPQHPFWDMEDPFVLPTFRSPFTIIDLTKRYFLMLFITWHQITPNIEMLTIYYRRKSERWISTEVREKYILVSQWTTCLSKTKRKAKLNFIVDISKKKWHGGYF